MHMYANVTQLYLPFKPKDYGKNCIYYQNPKIVWLLAVGPASMSHNQLKLNDDKTKHNSVHELAAPERKIMH